MASRIPVANAAPTIRIGDGPPFLRFFAFFDPVAALSRAACELLQPRRAPFDEKVGLGHRFIGGDSPVATRHIFDAARRAAIVAPALSPA